VQRLGAAKTLHALLGTRGHSRRFVHNAHNPLELDVLVVDEASMVHLDMMAAVLDALPPHAQLVLMGVTTEVCVQTTMREANDRGYDCLLIEDATDSYFPEFKAATLAMITAQGGIVGWVAPAAVVLTALLDAAVLPVTTMPV
jgi:isochorismate hydrolase